MNVVQAHPGLSWPVGINRHRRLCPGAPLLAKRLFFQDFEI